MPTVPIVNKVKVPFLFTEAKRFFRAVEVKYYHFSSHSIATRTHQKFPCLLISFDETRIRVSPIPCNGWSVSFSASSFSEVLQKIEKHGFVLNLGKTPFAK